MRNSTTMLPALLSALTLAACGDPPATPPSPTADPPQRPAAAAVDPRAPASAQPSAPAAAPSAPDAGVAAPAEPAVPTAADAGAPDLGAVELVETGGLALAELAVARGVEGRNPVDPGSTFSLADAARIYAFMVVDNPERIETEVAVSFAPANGGAERGAVTVKVGPQPKWRTWAYHSHFKRPGRWIAVVRDAEGAVLGRAPFELVD